MVNPRASPGKFGSPQGERVSLKTSVYLVPKTSAQGWRMLKSSSSLARRRCQPEHPHRAANLHGGQGAAGGLRGAGAQLRGTESGSPEEP